MYSFKILLHRNEIPCMNSSSPTSSFMFNLPFHSVNGFQRKCPSGLPTGITYRAFWGGGGFGQGHFPCVTAVCGEASDTNPKLLNEPKGSTGHVKSTTGQPWHSSQLLALSKSVISALSNVLWGSNCTTDLTQMKPFYPFNSPHGTTTTNSAWKIMALSLPSLLRSLTLQAVQVFMLSTAILALFLCHWYMVNCTDTTLNS